MTLWIIAVFAVSTLSFVAGVFCRDAARRDSAQRLYLALLCVHEEPLSRTTKAIVEEAIWNYEGMVH